MENTPHPGAAVWETPCSRPLIHADFYFYLQGYIFTLQWGGALIRSRIFLSEA
jgi:hypothetical protein